MCWILTHGRRAGAAYVCMCYAFDYTFVFPNMKLRQKRPPSDRGWKFPCSSQIYPTGVGCDQGSTPAWYVRGWGRHVVNVCRWMTIDVCCVVCEGLPLSGASVVGLLGLLAVDCSPGLISSPNLGTIWHSRQILVAQLTDWPSVRQPRRPASLRRILSRMLLVIDMCYSETDAWIGDYGPAWITIDTLVYPLGYLAYVCFTVRSLSQTPW